MLKLGGLTVNLLSIQVGASQNSNIIWILYIVKLIFQYTIEVNSWSVSSGQNTQGSVQGFKTLTRVRLSCPQVELAKLVAWDLAESLSKPRKLLKMWKIRLKI